MVDQLELGNYLVRFNLSVPAVQEPNKTSKTDLSFLCPKSEGIIDRGFASTQLRTENLTRNFELWRILFYDTILNIRTIFVDQNHFTALVSFFTLIPKSN